MCNEGEREKLSQYANRKCSRWIIRAPYTYRVVIILATALYKQSSIEMFNP